MLVRLTDATGGGRVIKAAVRVLLGKPVSLCFDGRFWHRETNAKARWIDSLFASSPLASSASIMNCVLDRSGRLCLP